MSGLHSSATFNYLISHNKKHNTKAQYEGVLLLRLRRAATKPEAVKILLIRCLPFMSFCQELTF